MSLNQNEKSNAIKSLDIALSDSHFDKDEAFEILRENGIDPDKTVGMHLQIIKKLQIKAEIECAKAKREKNNLFQLAKEKLKIILREKELDKNKLSTDFVRGQLALQFRKLENLSEADIDEILEEAQLLKIIKELDNFNNV
jgi:hypothetical protein